MKIGDSIDLSFVQNQSWSRHRVSLSDTNNFLNNRQIFLIWKAIMKNQELKSNKKKKPTSSKREKVYPHVFFPAYSSAVLLFFKANPLHKHTASSLKHSLVWSLLSREQKSELPRGTLPARTWERPFQLRFVCE